MFATVCEVQYDPKIDSNVAPKFTHKEVTSQKDLYSTEDENDFYNWTLNRTQDLLVTESIPSRALSAIRSPTSMPAPSRYTERCTTRSLRPVRAHTAQVPYCTDGLRRFYYKLPSSARDLSKPRQSVNFVWVDALNDWLPKIKDPPTFISIVEQPSVGYRLFSSTHLSDHRNGDTGDKRRCHRSHSPNMNYRLQLSLKDRLTICNKCEDGGATTNVSKSFDSNKLSSQTGSLTRILNSDSTDSESSKHKPVNKTSLEETTHTSEATNHISSPAIVSSTNTRKICQSSPRRSNTLVSRNNILSNNNALKQNKIISHPALDMPNKNTIDRKNSKNQPKSSPVPKVQIPLTTQAAQRKKSRHKKDNQPVHNEGSENVTNNNAKAAEADIVQTVQNNAPDNNIKFDNAQISNEKEQTTNLDNRLQALMKMSQNMKSKRESKPKTKNTNAVLETRRDSMPLTPPVVPPLPELNDEPVLMTKTLTMPDLPDLRAKTVNNQAAIRQQIQNKTGLHSINAKSPKEKHAQDDGEDSLWRDLAEKRRRQLMSKINLKTALQKRANLILEVNSDAISFAECDFLSRYCIFKDDNLQMYQQCFESIDEQGSGYITNDEALLGLRVMNAKLSTKDETYMERILELAGYNISRGADCKLFCVMAALSTKISALDDWLKNLISEMDMGSLEHRVFMCKSLWECNVDHTTNRIPLQQLSLDLRAGGISEEHEKHVCEKLSHLISLDLLDFLTYIPLFLLIHSSVVVNPLDDSRSI